MLKKFFCPPCLIGLVLALAVIGGYFLLRGAYQTQTQTPEEIVPEEMAEIKEITVSGTEYSFSPSLISVSAGDQVKVTFSNRGRIGHNFVIREIGVGTRTISPGQSDTIEFTAPAAGTYSFICSVPGHRANGMEGTLEVE